MHELRDATISVVIIDDEALESDRACTTLILEAADDIRVVGVGDSGAAADLVSTHQPSVVLLDIRMPAPDGLTVLRHLRTLPDPPQVVMLTTFDMDNTVRTALELGAAGYLLKETDPEHLPHFVRTAAAGGVVLAGSPAHRMRTAIRAGGADPEAAALVDTLTDREVSVLRQLARGDSNAEIARTLHLSQGTVKDHVSAILAKLRVTGRVPAALIAARADILRCSGTDPGETLLERMYGADSARDFRGGRGDAPGFRPPLCECPLLSGRRGPAPAPSHPRDRGHPDASRPPLWLRDNRSCRRGVRPRRERGSTPAP